MNKIVGIIIPAVTAAAGIGAFLLVPKTPEPTTSEQTSNSFVAPQVEETTPIVAQPVAPVAEPVPQPAVTQPVQYKWAKEMAEAGIPEADFGLVTEMLLDDNGWKTKGDKVWIQANKRIGANTLVGNLKFAQKWVSERYDSWTQAYNRFNTSGNF